MYVAIQDAKYAVSSSEKLLRLSRWDSPFHRWNVPRNIYTFRYLINETWNTASIYSIMRSFVLLLFFFFLHLYVANCVNWNLVDWNVWLYSNFLELKMNNYSWIKTILFFLPFEKWPFPAITSLFRRALRVWGWVLIFSSCRFFSNWWHKSYPST